jgi:predicted porin
MNKHLIALALLGLAAGTAAAQSSVTIFGVVDASVRGVKTGDVSAKKLSSDGNSSSRFGFRGVEDLGNGLQAGFWLEAPFSPDNGTGNTSKFFNRRSTVSLIGKQWGEVRLGRDNLAIWNNASAFDPFGTVGVGTITQLYSTLGAFAGWTAPTTVGGAATTTSLDNKRVDNAVSYFLPGGLGGVYGQLQGSFGEGAAGKTNGARLGFKIAGFDGAVAINNFNVVAPVGTVAPGLLATGGDYRQLHAGATYDFGPAKLWGSYVQAKREIAGSADRKLKVWQLGVTAKVVESGTVKAVYGRASDYYRANQWALGYQHDLSKRTALYATYGEIKNKTGDTGAVANFLVPDAPAAVGTAPLKSKGYEIGVRHSF